MDPSDERLKVIGVLNEKFFNIGLVFPCLRTVPPSQFPDEGDTIKVLPVELIHVF